MRSQRVIKNFFMNETTRSVGRSVGRVTTTTSSSLSLSLFLFPSLLRVFTLLPSVIARLPLMLIPLPLFRSPLLLSASLCLTALARVKRCALACTGAPLAPRGYSYQPIRIARGKRYYCCTTRNSRTAGVIVEA